MRSYSGKNILVTGGAGFIGSALIRKLLRETDVTVINVDKLTYAGHLVSLAECADSPRHVFERVDICNAAAIERVFAKYQPSVIVHLAAESHVDRSIDGPADFVNTNVLGTYVLLEVAVRYAAQLKGGARERFVFHHVSTDEVYGSLGPSGLFTEDSPYRPNSPYSASKAASDHLVRAWHRTYGLPIVMTNCSNNYGPYQFPEKLIPLSIVNAIAGKPILVYGSGDNVRDWLYVDDHVDALWRVLAAGAVGETYNIGGCGEYTNIAVVRLLCKILDELLPQSPHVPHASLISFVQDRPGHDKRYAIDAGKIRCDLGWEPTETFETGLRKTVHWYLDNKGWWQSISNGTYRTKRLGLEPGQRFQGLETGR